MNVKDLKLIVDDLPDEMEIKVGSISVKAADVNNNNLVFEIDYTGEFYTANGEVYSYEYIRDKLKKLNYYENGDPINIKHLTSIGITTANNFYMLDLDKLQSTGDKLTMNEFLSEIPEINDINNYELYVNEYNSVTNVIVDTVNHKVCFLASSVIEDYYNEIHKELVINSTVEHIVSEGITKMKQIEVEVLAENLNVSYNELKSALERKGITIIPFMEN